MSQITLQFFGALRYFLPASRAGGPFDYAFDQKISIKHIIESCGVPHPEVGVIRANDKPVDLSYHVQPGDSILVFPIETGQVESTEPARFVLDNHLGKLADYLRLLGFDTLYHSEWDDEQLAQVAFDQSRILLTRDRGLLKRKIVTRGYCVRHDLPDDQVEEVIRQFGLTGQVTPFIRCPRCNGLLASVEKSAIIDRLQPLTCRFYDEFTQCQDCGQIYWKGSHYQRMQPFIERYSPPGAVK